MATLMTYNSKTSKKWPNYYFFRLFLWFFLIVQKIDKNDKIVWNQPPKKISGVCKETQNVYFFQLLFCSNNILYVFLWKKCQAFDDTNLYKDLKRVYPYQLHYSHSRYQSNLTANYLNNLRFEIPDSRHYGLLCIWYFGIWQILILLQRG